ncbi:copper amine oxidase N-terminal domain-containing protein [Chengkuizengella axinellae]|uniref:Copper amine oxidase N-terminal domain-containing protein n=1 Tax=Chengkuizengella axinellae TaxID=3064388 RepID=A0ABT9IZ95_9BACL|nr:copper amine oxidase N-terminal domain-containing protein [Chengkuizengella sp. 2205SS18-9]MDP5274699.1 copper amine oxidase N-terminal domain-containing protein [Chengkuizengella sp. 2205SS18-9]
MKFKFITGFVLGALLFGSIGVYASGSNLIEVFYSIKDIKINNESSMPEQEPFIYNGTTYVPLRYVSEALDYEVEWDAESKAILIGNAGEGQSETTESTDTPLSPKLIKDVEGPEMIELGKASVRALIINYELIRDLNHFQFNFDEGNPVDVYVTDDYIEKFGEGFAYSEVGDMIESISQYKDIAPHLDSKKTLDIFFYTDDSDLLPTDEWGSFSNWDDRYSEILINGSKLAEFGDFRVDLTHELVHYFDLQYEFYEVDNMPIFENYWDASDLNWLFEGGAEYGSYFFYDYDESENYQNFAETTTLRTETTFEGYDENEIGLYGIELWLNDDAPLDSFDDLYDYSSNDYNAYFSFYWFLVEEYGYETIYDYMEYISDHFKASATITQGEKDEAANKFFGMTEEEVLEAWLDYFDYFDDYVTPVYKNIDE